MITRTQLFEIYRTITGSTVYHGKALSVREPQTPWQVARVQEYAFMCEVR